MMPARKSKSDKMLQQARFMETARALGADEDEAAFKAKLAQIARQKPKGDVPEPPDATKDGKL